MKMNISVVIPVLNSSEKLYMLLTCLKKQVSDYSFETIIVDDGSTENLKPVVSKFADSLRLFFIRLATNQGPAVARNAGIQAASGEIIVFTDSDCTPQTDWLQKMVVPFLDPEVAGVKGAYKTDQEDSWAQLSQLEFQERYDLLESHSDIDFIDTYSGAYRKKDLLKVEGFNVSFPGADNEDVDLSFRVKKMGGRFVFVRDAVVGHLHREGWLNYAKLKYRRGFWRMKVYSDHPEKAGNDSYTPLSLKIQLLLLLIFPTTILVKRLRFPWKIAWLFSCFPLIKIALPKRKDLALMVPVFCLIRAIALVGGILSGLYAERGRYLQRCFQIGNLRKQDSST